MDYDQAINAQIAAKNRGEDRAARDYVAIAVAIAIGFPFLVFYFLP
jgi:hypothetical protein